MNQNLIKMIGVVNLSKQVRHLKNDKIIENQY